MLLKTPLALCDDMTEGLMGRLTRSGLGRGEGSFLFEALEKH